MNGNDLWGRGRMRLMAAVLSTAALLLAAVPAQAGGGDAAFQWKEGYAGVFIGSGRSHNRIVDVEGFANWGNPGWTVAHERSGAVGGVLIGQTLAIGNTPLRLEIDGTIGSGGLPASADTLDPAGRDETVRTSFEWMATARVGIGEAFGLAGVFVTTGLALARIDRSVTDIDYGASAPPRFDPDDSFQDRSTALGWVIGVGHETKLSDAWMVRLEASYMDFGSSTHYVNRSGNNRCGPEGLNRPCPYEVAHSVGTIRAAIVHRFGLQ